MCPLTVKGSIGYPLGPEPEGCNGSWQTPAFYRALPTAVAEHHIRMEVSILFSPYSFLTLLLPDWVRR